MSASVRPSGSGVGVSDEADGGVSAWVAGFVVFGLLLLPFVVFTYRWFSVQGVISINNPEDWGHAFLVPVISGYLVWRHRDALMSAPKKAYWPGLIPLVTGLMGYCFFLVSALANHMAQGFSLVLAVFGAVLLLLGPRAMGVLFFPIAYLIFGVTISERVMIPLTFELQQLAAIGGFILLNVVGIQTDLAGNTLTVFSSEHGAVPLNVAEACSGMRMLIAFIALGGAVALVGCRTWWQRVVMLAAAPPLALGLNVVRVAVLGVLSLVDPNLATGEAHTWIGTALLLPGFGLYMLILWALNKAISPADRLSEGKT